jgi:ribosomal protein S18 acetylase RimI-like enzyme
VTMQVFETRDRALLRQALQHDRAGTFYMAADLESPHFEQCRWFVARETRRQGRDVTGVILVFQGLEVPTVLVTGDLEALVEIVRQAGSQLPSRSYMKLAMPEMGAFARAYSFSREEELDVMVIDKGATSAKAPEGVSVRLMESSQPLEPILDVYRDYPGNFFDPAQLQVGVYAGAWIDKALVAVGGTHAFAPREGVAALGNVTTARRFRGRGLCRVITSFLVAELRNRGCDTIGLHVASANAPAIACYRRSGFAQHDRIFQIVAERKETS